MWRFILNGNIFDRLFPDNLFSLWFFGEPEFPKKED